MKFSTQEEYGLRCLLQIAKSGRTPEVSENPRGQLGNLTIPEISKLEGLSPTHVAKLLMILRREGFIMSTRGQAGGYSLSRPASEISVGEVLATLGGKLYDGDFCNRHAGSRTICPHDSDCGVRSVWQIVQTAIDNVLDRLTIEDMISGRREPGLEPLQLNDLADRPRAANAVTR